MSTAMLEMPSVGVVLPSLPTSPKREVVQKRITTVYDELFADLKAQYRIPNETPVLAFLRKHGHLIPLLKEGRAAVNVFFGEETPIQLNFRRDSETGVEYLIAWILTDLPASDAVSRLLEFADTWYSEQSEVIGDLLNYNLGSAENRL